MLYCEGHAFIFEPNLNLFTYFLLTNPFDIVLKKMNSENISLHIENQTGALITLILVSSNIIHDSMCYIFLW